MYWYPKKQGLPVPLVFFNLQQNEMKSAIQRLLVLLEAKQRLPVLLGKH